MTALHPHSTRQLGTVAPVSVASDAVRRKGDGGGLE
jgi:hypothetical protein